MYKYYRLACNPMFSTHVAVEDQLIIWKNHSIQNRDLKTWCNYVINILNLCFTLIWTLRRCFVVFYAKIRHTCNIFIQCTIFHNFSTCIWLNACSWIKNLWCNKILFSCNAFEGTANNDERYVYSPFNLQRVRLWLFLSHLTLMSEYMTDNCQFRQLCTKPALPKIVTGKINPLGNGDAKPVGPFGHFMPW